mmetsp:Transcript_32851/g.60197  ORF Transcript_32851/g.60197 Transcript_32851/m.60197 type:complete len:305 (+) Transcript_32851:115-1029(+)
MIIISLQVSDAIFAPKCMVDIQRNQGASTKISILFKGETYLLHDTGGLQILTFLPHEVLCSSSFSEVHRRTDLAIIAFKRHVLSKNSSNLFSHILAGLSVMPKCRSPENKGDEKNRPHEHMRGHTSPRRLALFLSNALVKVSAAFTFGAHLGLRSLKVTIANCSEDSVDRESSAKSNSIDKCRGEDDDTTFHLSLHLQIKERVRLILIKSTAISHAVVDHNLINASVLVTIFYTILIRKIIRAITAFHELSNIIPPIRSNSIRITMLLPNTDAPQTLLDNISSRNTVIKIIVGVSRAVPSVVCA